MIPTRFCLLVSLCAAAAAIAAGPSTAAAGAAVARSFEPSDTVRMSLSYRRTGRGAVRLASFSANRLAVIDDGRGRIRLRRGGRTARLMHGPHDPRRWSRLAIVLDSHAGRLRVRLGGRSVTRRLALRPERRVRAGGSRRSRYRIRKIRIRASRASGRPFAPGSVWNAPLRRNAPLDRRSSTWVSELRRQLGHAEPWVNTTEYSAPVYTVPAGQRRVRVKLDTPWVPRLEEAFAGVPIPPGAKPAGGSDKHMVVWQPSTDTMWEFWLAERRGDGWHARWGGRMRNVSRNPGYFTDPSDWGATATSLPLMGGLMRIAELRAGRIDHALAFAIPDTRAEWFTAPAQRTDGNVRGAGAIPEGARFRLDPSLDVESRPMDPIVRTIARAAQRYGMVLRDKAGAVTFYAEDPAPSGTNPYAGRAGLFGGKWINEILRNQFPWHRLQVLRTAQVCCWKR